LSSFVNLLIHRAYLSRPPLPLPSPIFEKKGQRRDGEMGFWIKVFLIVVEAIDFFEL